MNSENQCSPYDEHNKLSRIINFRLPHGYRKVGMIGAALVMAFLVGYKCYGGDGLLIKDICRHVMLLLLLMATMCKDPIEDEYIEHIRFQAYVVSFIFAVSYAVLLPLLALVLDLLITKITGDGQVNFYEISAFEVIFTLVCFQLLVFETLKRFGRAE